MSPAKLIEKLKGKTSLTTAVKEYLAEGNKELEKLHTGAAASGPGRPWSNVEADGGMAVCRRRTLLIDDLLRALFEIKATQLGFRGKVALVSLGGYGRSELNICSDIDLTLLYRGRMTPVIEELNQELLYILWDTGLDMGFSIRTPGESITLACEDHKTMTAMLDMRLIHGDAELYDGLRTKAEKKLFNRRRTRSFIEEKLQENNERHGKYGESIYILEPNVKEGEGGLRDLHMARWIIRATNGENIDPVALGLISAEDRATVEASLNFLLWVRNELHFDVGRKADQLTFDQQERIAPLLGFRKTATALAVESFMQTYYRHATNISHYSDLMLSRCLHWEEKTPVYTASKRVIVDDDYVITDGALALKRHDAFSVNPAAMIKAFELAQANRVRMDQATRDLILGYLPMVDDGFRNSPEAAASFMSILRGANVYRTLKDMHDLKFLEHYIPEFAEITCKVQHDRYHVYTVDAHTLFAVREIERLRDEYKPEFALLTTIFEEYPAPEILYLAVLFHDIGKGRGPGHADTGGEMVREICSRLGLDDDDSNMVRFLVKHHLLLADTAQYRDLHDEKLIVEFARTVGDVDRLNLLYLLTFADVRAVGPEVWSQWKGALFQELYFKALTVLERGSFEPEEAEVKRTRVKETAVEILAEEGFPRDAAHGYFEYFPARYFLANGPDIVANHVLMLRELEGRPYIMKVRQDTFREYTEIIVGTRDVHGLFSMITGVMAANSVDILGAQIYTLTDGTALDILQVKSSWGEYITEESKLEKIEADLADVLTGKVLVERLVGKRKRKSILDTKAMPKVRTRVQIDNEVSDEYTVIDVRTENRLGLLYDITRTLSAQGLYIYVSKITTKGDEAADIFYVKDIFGQKIYYDEKLREIADSVYEVLEENA